MTAYPAWTPASRPGIVPLRPLTFGQILGRSFTALRQNPRVLLGFALVVQSLVTIVSSTVLAAVGVWAMMRVASLQPNSADFETVFAGSMAIVGIVAFVVALATTAFSVVVEGVVVLEVAHEVLAEKLTLRQLWRTVRPVVWRLIGYSLAVLAAVSLLLGIVIGGLVLLSMAIGWMTLLLGIPLLLAMLPLTYWLTVKLLLVPATIVIEHATIRGAIVRSWRLTRGRFWVALGIVVIISFAFSLLAQVVSTPMSLISMGLGQIFAPTGDVDTGAVISLVVVTVATQIVIVLIQAVALVVQATATSLVYVDCRMRHEGLDLDLLSYVEQRDAGRTDLPDPYRQHIGRVVAPRPAATLPPPGHGYPPAGHSPTAYPPAYAAAPEPPVYAAPHAQAYPAPQAQAPYATAPSPESRAGQTPPAPPASAAPPEPPASTAAPSRPPGPSPTQWTAPGEER